MHISAAYFYEKDDIKRLEICIVCGESVFIVLFEKNTMIIYICKSEILKTRV